MEFSYEFIQMEIQYIQQVLVTMSPIEKLYDMGARINKKVDTKYYLTRIKNLENIQYGKYNLYR